MNNTVAIVVLYQPNLKKLQHLFESVCCQVNAIVFVDNSPDPKVQTVNQNWLKTLKKSYYYFSMSGNFGIATAQNKGIEFAKTLNADFVLLLDQDSVLPKNMVANLLSAYQDLIKKNKQVALVAPCFVDEKTGNLTKIFKRSKLLPNKSLPDQEPYIEVDYAIASGSLIAIDVLDRAGMMRDDLFIDWVDIEWCYRARQFGLLSYVIPSVVMNHSIGDEMAQGISLHSDFRNYFIVRNSLYLALYGDLPINFKIIQFFKTPAYVLFYSYHSKKPFYSLKLLLTAIKDGVIKKMGKGHFENKGL